MFDLIFDSMQAFNALGFMLGGFVFFAISALLIGMWVYWRVASYRTRGEIVAVKSTGVRRTDQEWLEEYEDSTAINEPEKDFDEVKKEYVESFKTTPIKTFFASLIALVFVLMPFAFFGVGAWMAGTYIDLKTNGHYTTGKVVSYEESYDSESGYSYYPVVHYKEQNGVRHTKKDRIGTGSRSYREGEEVGVYYDPDEPDEFIIDSFWRYMGFAFAFMGISSVFLILMFIAVISNLGLNDKSGVMGAQTKATRKKIRHVKSKYYINQKYIPVYKFRAPDGGMVEIDGVDDQSNYIQDKLPGKKVKLMVIPGNPPKVKKPGKILLFFGIIFFVPALLFFQVALSQLKFGWGLVIVLTGVTGMILYKSRKAIPKIIEVMKLPEFKEARKEFLNIKVESMKQADGFVLTPKEIDERIHFLDRQSILGVIIMFFFSIGMTIGGYHMFNDMSNLSGNAMVARGEIVDMVSRSNSDSGYTYYPVVEFEALDGEEYRFQGKTGSNPPMHQTGDHVAVLYDVEDPHHAIVDGGFWNWVPSIGLMLLGLITIYYSVTWMFGVSSRLMQRKVL